MELKGKMKKMESKRLVNNIRMAKPSPLRKKSITKKMKCLWSNNTKKRRARSRRRQVTKRAV